MDLKNYVGILSVFSIVFSVMALLVGTVGATDPAPPAFTGSGNFTHGNGHTLSPDAIITMLEQKGVDVSQVKTALQNGDTATVKTWLDSHRPAHNDQFSNSTQQQQKIQTLITSLEQKGVDVSQVKTALQNGDTAAVKTWLENYFQTHKPQMMTHSKDPRFDLTNVTWQQQVITNLEQKGVDVTALKTALQNGDTAAVKTWLDSHRQAHNDSMPAGHHGRQSRTNSTQQS